jgi:hypothetical protein
MSNIFATLFSKMVSALFRDSWSGELMRGRRSPSAFPPSTPVHVAIDCCCGPLEIWIGEWINEAAVVFQ